MLALTVLTISIVMYSEIGTMFWKTIKHDAKMITESR